MSKKQYMWLDGKFVESGSASVNILTHSLQYGSGMFEGIRAYKTKRGTAIFRLKEHAKRFMRTAKILNMPLGITERQLEHAVISTIRKNGLEECYIRPFAFYDDSGIGLGVIGKKVSVAVAAIPFGSYFGNRAKGITCKVSSWNRISSNILPPQAKASGNYANSILASLEAKKAGAEEAILTTAAGYVAEGPGENIFLVEDGRLVTPSKESDILLGITRASIITLAEELGIIVEERLVHREELYTCDELFFCGTAAEVTPIVSVDSRKVGGGTPGPITKLISDKFFAVARGEASNYAKWLTYL